MAGVLKANINYLQKLADILYGKKNSLDYSLVRKEVFVSTANLVGSFSHECYLSQEVNNVNSREIYEFVVLNHVLSSNIAGFIEGIREMRNLCSKEILQQVKRSISSLEESLQLP